MPSYRCFRPIECCLTQSVSVSVPQDKFQGSAIFDSAKEWKTGKLRSHPATSFVAVWCARRTTNSRHVRAIPWPSGRWRARRRIDTGHAGRLYGRERARGPRLVKTQCSGSSGTEPPLQRPIGFCLQMRPAIGLIDFLSASCLIVFKASLLYPESQLEHVNCPRGALGGRGLAWAGPLPRVPTDPPLSHQVGIAPYPANVGALNKPVHHNPRIAIALGQPDCSPRPEGVGGEETALVGDMWSPSAGYAALRRRE